ncbi:MAG: hypothetical protein HQM04_03225 [Magnetococcales bacterium]|nr:hypothetical protein [Magnetococcales bacterium]MBF0114034.1 hypothetical protein [Magnetococcales bacterium]
MDSHDQQTEWVRFCQDLARLRVELERVREDELFRALGGTILYVVDTDVVKLFINPPENEKYVHIFRDSGEDLRALAYRIGDYLFLARGLTPINQPLYMVSPHVDELLGMTDAISQKAFGQMDSAQRQSHKLCELLEQFSKEADAKSVADIIKQAPDLMSVLYDGELPSPQTELKRLARLGTEDRLLNAETSKLLPYLDAEALAESAATWTELLSETKSKSRPLPRIKRDAQALAWLVSANDELRQRQSEGATPCRVHLLTGDEGILHAYELYRKNLADPDVRKEHILRHPRQFIPFVISKSLGSTRDAVDNLTTLLDRLFNPITWIFKKPEEYFAALRTIQYPPAKSTPGLITLLGLRNKKELGALVEEITSQWTEILNATAVSQPIERARLEPDNISHRVAELLMRQDVGTLLQQRVKELFSHLQGAYSILGFMSGFAELLKELFENQKRGTSRTSGRVAIALRFDDQNNDDFMDYHKQLRLALKGNVLKFVREKQGKMTPYILNLTHAMIAADASKWDICREYCQLAYKDADNNRGEYPHEAAYFHAAAIRHSCRSQEDVASALKFLELARHHWQQAHPNETDWRLDAERLALSAVVLNHNAFSENGGPWSVREIAPLQQIWDGFWVLLDQPTIANIPDRIAAQETVPSWEGRLYRQIVVNLSSIYLHHRHIEPNTAVFSPEKAQLLRTLSSNLYNKIESEQDESYFTRFIQIMCAWESAENSNKHTYVTKLEAHLREIEQRGTVLFEYEERKFKYYLDHIRTITDTVLSN